LQVAQFHLELSVGRGQFVVLVLVFGLVGAVAFI